MRLSKEIIDRKLETAPQSVRDAVMSDEVAASLVGIGQEHNLHIDQIGILEEESLYVMLGITDSGEFIKNLRDRIGLSSDEAGRVAQDVNDKVLLLIRSNLQNPSQTQTAQPSNPESIEKEDILAGIEDPQPAPNPLATARPAIHQASSAVPMNMPSTPVNLPTETPTQPAPSVSREFIAGKMTEAVNMPPQKYTADPYRESIN